jgi:hypothetical protein
MPRHGSSPRGVARRRNAALTNVITVFSNPAMIDVEGRRCDLADNDDAAVNNEVISKYKKWTEVVSSSPAAVCPVA